MDEFMSAEGMNFYCSVSHVHGTCQQPSQRKEGFLPVSVSWLNLWAHQGF